MDWYGDEFIDSVRQRLAANVTAAASFAANVMKESVSVPYPPASAPGEEPHWRTGGLQSRITSTEAEVVDEETVKALAGAPTNVDYWLETGTKKMKKRPFVRPALYNNGDTVNSIATHGIGEPTV